MLGKIEGRKRRGRQRTRWLDGVTDSTDMSLSKLWEMVRTGRTGKPGVLQSMGSQRVTERLNNNRIPTCFTLNLQMEGVGGGLLDKSNIKSRAQDCLVNRRLHHPAGHLSMLPLVTSPQPRPPPTLPSWP